MEQLKHGKVYLNPCKLINGINIPSNLQGKITVLSTCNLSTHCINLFNMALVATSKQLEKESIDKASLLNVNIVFTSDGKLQLEMENITLGFHMDLCLYNLKAIENDKNDPKLITACFVEELAHHFWNIDDEIEVKHKVFHILKNIYPEITIEYILEGLY